MPRMNRGILLGISGKARAGKDEFARGILDKFERLSFADDVKAVAKMLFHWDGQKGDELRCGRCGEIFEAAVCPRCGAGPPKAYPIGRRLLVDLGTKHMRAIWPDVWVDRILRRIDPDKNYVVTDVRFRNEFELIKEFGGYMVRIERPNRPLTSVEDNISETDLDDADFDFVIVNDGTIKELHDKALEIYEETFNLDRL